jgi:cysteine desulfurase
MGLSASEAAATLRVGIGRFTSPADIDAASCLLADAWRLRQGAPLAAAEA